ncbi:hypothetical protein [Tistrella arctica]
MTEILPLTAYIRRFIAAAPEGAAVMIEAIVAALPEHTPQRVRRSIGRMVHDRSLSRVAGMDAIIRGPRWGQVGARADRVTMVDGGPIAPMITPTAHPVLMAASVLGVDPRGRRPMELVARANDALRAAGLPVIRYPVIAPIHSVADRGRP